MTNFCCVGKQEFPFLVGLLSLSHATVSFSCRVDVTQVNYLENEMKNRNEEKSHTTIIRVSTAPLISDVLPSVLHLMDA